MKITMCATRKIVGGGAIASAKALMDLAVIVAVIGKAIGLDHRPIGQVAKNSRWSPRCVLSLRDGTATQRNVAPAGDRVAAHLPLRLDYDHRRAGLPRHDGRRESHGSAAILRCLPPGSIGRGPRGPGRGKAWRDETAGGHRRLRTTTFRKKLRREKFADGVSSPLVILPIKTILPASGRQASPRSGLAGVWESKIQSIR